MPGLLTGALLGLTGAWIGLTVQHCANHGAMSTSPAVNGLLGATPATVVRMMLAFLLNALLLIQIASPLASYKMSPSSLEMRFYIFLGDL